ncbi:MAG: RfaE bifunctional protein [Chitinophagaceae bacterium]|nr:RfaE bifunctional protein [Chitinophagaceae bacterium]
MKNSAYIPGKIVSSSRAKQIIQAWKVKNKTIAFTNGCFDILHEGHIFSLSEAAKQADYLVVGMNSDTSVRWLKKGPNRPVNNEHSRSLLLASLVMVDLVIIFDEETPQQLISFLLPDILVKGGDYTVEQVAGAKEVIANGGQVIINPILEGFSTTGIIEKMKHE